MEVAGQVQYWLQTAEDNISTAQSMLLSGHYDWSLFVGHLALEKVLKALVVKHTETTPPKIHDLVKLSRLANVTLSKEQEEYLFVVNTFNLEARYPEYLREMNKNVTKEVAEKTSHL